MRIEYQTMQLIGHLAKSQPALIKRLKQPERDVVRAALVAIKQGDSSIDLKGFGERQLQRLTAKLSLHVLPSSKEKSSLLKGITNPLGLRISSASLEKLVGELDPQLLTIERKKRLSQLQEKLQAHRGDISMLKRSMIHDRPHRASHSKKLEKMQKEEKALARTIIRLSRPLLSDQLALVSSALEQVQARIEHQARHLDLLIVMNQFWRGLAFTKDPTKALQAQEKLLANSLFTIAGQLIQKIEKTPAQSAELRALKAGYALPVHNRSEYQVKLQAIGEALHPFPLERALFLQAKGFAETLESTLERALRSKPTKAQLKTLILASADAISRKTCKRLTRR